MYTVKNLIAALMAAIPITAIPRAMYCIFKWKTDEEQGSLYRRRLTNLLIFIGIAEGISSFLYIILEYIK